MFILKQVFLNTYDSSHLHVQYSKTFIGRSVQLFINMLKLYLIYRVICTTQGHTVNLPESRPCCRYSTSLPPTASTVSYANFDLCLATSTVLDFEPNIKFLDVYIYCEQACYQCYIYAMMTVRKLKRSKLPTVVRSQHAVPNLLFVLLCFYNVCKQMSLGPNILCRRYILFIIMQKGQEQLEKKSIYL